MDHEKSVDESWKDSVAGEKESQKEQLFQGPAEQGPQPASAGHPQDKDRAEAPAEEHGEVDFLNYVTSLALQAMIFLGEIPNPMADNRTEKNYKQAKFLIDTLILLRDKTKGNLSSEEQSFLDGSIYELQMKYVEKMSREKS